MIWSVDVGIQRRTEGHKDLDFAFSAVEVEVPSPALLISSAIFANELEIRRRFMVMKRTKIQPFLCDSSVVL